MTGMGRSAIRTTGSRTLAVMPWLRVDLNLLRWFHSHDCLLTEQVSEAAVTLNSLKILRWLHEHNYSLDGLECSYQAAIKGNMKLLRWLRGGRVMSVILLG